MMPTVLVVFLVVASSIDAKSQGMTWWKKSKTLNKEDNVEMREGKYVVQLKDNLVDGAGFYLTYRKRMRRTSLFTSLLGAGTGAVAGISFASVAVAALPFIATAGAAVGAAAAVGATAAALVSIPIYHLFYKGLLEVTPQNPVIFTLEHAKDSDIPNAFRMKVDWKLTKDPNSTGYISGDKLKRETKAAVMVAKGGPLYVSGTPYSNVYLKMIFKSGKERWLKAGKKQLWGQNYNLFTSRWRMSEWLLVQKDWGNNDSSSSSSTSSVQKDGGDDGFSASSASSSSVV